VLPAPAGKFILMLRTEQASVRHRSARPRRPKAPFAASGGVAGTASGDTGRLQANCRPVYRNSGRL